MSVSAPGTILLNSGAEVIFDVKRPELGRFLRATRKFNRGELIVQETPLFRVRGGAIHDAGKLASLIRDAGLFLPADGSPVLERLQDELRHDEGDDALTVRLALYFNSFGAGPSGMDQVVFQMLSRPNHSCAPNCFVDGDEGTLRAIKEISPGEDLTISYLDEATLLWPKERRISELSNGWDFICTCIRCAAPFDDTRRFHNSCVNPDCKGELLAHGAGASQIKLVCGLCGKKADAEVQKTLLEQERVAAAALQSALSGDLEEEWEEGQAKARAHKFCNNHPTHSLALELAYECQYPEAIDSQRILLKGIETILGEMPCQLAIDTNRVLARLLKERGDMDAWRATMEVAAKIACELDGKSSTAGVLNEWFEVKNLRTQEHAQQPSMQADLENCGGIAQDPIHASRETMKKHPKEEPSKQADCDSKKCGCNAQDPIHASRETMKKQSKQEPSKQADCDLENCGGIAQDPIHASRETVKNQSRELACQIDSMPKEDAKAENTSFSEERLVLPTSIVLISVALLAGVCYSVRRIQGNAH